tara:strand:- start:8682 stop:8930 length:249 start_codon:yes stop_codon:yes gene_type:complete
MTKQKPKGVDVDFVFAEMNALTELCQQSGMCPAEFFTHVLNYTFSALGAACPSPTDLMQVVGEAMSYGGQTASRMLEQMDEH